MNKTRTFEISEETLERTTDCPYDFVCLTDGAGAVCPVEAAIEGDGVQLKCKTDKSCFYKRSYGPIPVCACPTRRELFERYDV